MQPLIPPFIQQKLLADDFHGEVVGFTLNVDLSGFTPLTETLMQQGLAGAEQLSVILNDIFEPLVALVYASGGFIPYFAGDAFTAVYPLELDRAHALHLPAASGGSGPGSYFGNGAIASVISSPSASRQALGRERSTTAS